MRNFIKNCQRVLLEVDSPRLRDRKAHSASSAMNCLRDQYWSAIGEPATNPPDLVGITKMSLGRAIEKSFIKEQLLQNMHWFGTAPLGFEVPVGEVEPINWNGYIDALMATKKTDGAGFDKWVFEGKTKYGKGADYMYSNPTSPGDAYLAQIGLYMRHTEKKGITDEGSIHYTLLGDAHFGDMVQFHCYYDAKKLEVVAYEVTVPDGSIRKCNESFNIGKVLERWKKLEDMIRAKECPTQGDFKYKWELTPELISSLSESNLLAGALGNKVLGDWQPLYSRYKDKQLAADNTTPERTPEEIQLLQNEYKKRHPKQRRFK